MRTWLFTLVVAVVATMLLAPAAAADGLPANCGSAALLTNPSNGTQVPKPVPGTDGHYTPVLLVHGWNGNPSKPRWRAGISHRR